MSKNIVVKYKNLEILCFPNTISKFRKGQLNRDLVLAINQIFKNAQKYLTKSQPQYAYSLYAYKEKSVKM